MDTTNNFSKPSKNLFLLLLFTLFSSTIQAQSVFWDDTDNKGWPKVFQEVTMPSTIDDHQQKAYFYKSRLDGPQPLIISLHTWSGDYSQFDPLVGQIMTYGWNYIHPDFRGNNSSPDACGSEKVIQDIDDAISYALKNTSVDPTEIHVIGVSGGGMATILAYMKSRHPIKTFSAWVPISNLEDWYYETKSRGLKYASDLEKVTQTPKDSIDVEDLRKRSPLYMKVPLDLRKDTRLYLYTGIHDGYEGSVPITQTINFYNKLMDDWKFREDRKVTNEEIIELLSKRSFSNAPNRTIGGRKVHFQKNTGPVRLTVFEGKHEMLVEAAFDHIKHLHIVAIGDSNGAFENGWVTQLQKLRAKDKISNYSVSGNTIGFDNLGRADLNTLKNLEGFLTDAEDKVGYIDLVLVMLGTNDCKKVFENQQKEVVKNMRQLIKEIKTHKYSYKTPQILMILPPPYGADKQLIEKYEGAANRLDKLVLEFKKVAQNEKLDVVDVHTNMEEVLLPYSPDGVHFDIPAYQIIAFKIAQGISKMSGLKD
ncbi:GDSL-type esterase/lipase family protein [Chondrinema litorale]|uniref:GDSL-type esterase/lipase family protein n=1 Tax=Chondrinema litorale TaxID=2994555 RepID=UPI0025433F38|nr:GDSL-type esterase/lipase family protein [Chondrinema litorale]UZR97970.1 GDSL-type esterase/lipase family protein [Chondrinema litorale]